MKYLLDISGQKVLLSHVQLEIITEALAGADLLTQEYLRNVGPGGTSSYVPNVKTLLMHEWFRVNVVEDDYIDTVKLTMKLQGEQP
jgi:hypothetical protein